MIKIVIGFHENKDVLAATEIANKNEDLEVKIVNSDKELIDAIKNKEIDATIRGSLKSSDILKTLKKLNKNSKISRASYIKSDDFEFLLGPVGIDECKSLDEKIKLVDGCVEFIESLGKIPKIAILAGGRKEDLGRSPNIDKSITDSEKLAIELENELKLKNLDFSIKNYYILIEKAIKEENNIIITPDGISGNLIFRTLVLVNSWKSYGAITLGIEEIFIDTSREQTKEGYLRAIDLAYELCKSKQD
ncbi:phosphate butyryltransferase [Methanobrevibacter cuticularis]|uniref:Phosphate butyryltransferase n=1 Tax=Methanobrevibacter cuticularis TaxID=47311 RepID=A0A166CWB1_9EURY|nr:methanogenesis marker protein Mmp4/MtxX [Methanobrevibacter cuticularis]KZX14931.1 phosphate butyryltransferase [Methanobrevibacter cuticularis]